MAVPFVGALGLSQGAGFAKQRLRRVPMTYRRTDERAWHQGPFFSYRGSKNITVDVTGSSRPIRGLKLASPVVTVIKETKKLPDGKILDFGSGAWSRYLDCMRELVPDRDVYAVEYEEAFEGEEATAVKRDLANHVTFWRPIDFVRAKKVKFDLILLVSVLNVIPDEGHRRSILQSLAARLNPRGRLLIYQRIWPDYDAPETAISNGEDGWFIPQSKPETYTYRAATNKSWCTKVAEGAGLKRATTKASISASNTVLQLWERPY